MSNLAQTDRDVPLTFTVSAGALTATHGKMAVTQAAAVSTGSRGSVIGDAHFALVKADSTRRPPRYLDVLTRATGADAANVDALMWVEFWHEDSAQWIAAEPFRVCGRTVIAAAAAADPAEYISEIHSVDVPRGAIHGRFYITGFAVSQGIDITADADNDD